MENLEKIKEHFKNAVLVRCLWFSFYEIIPESIYFDARNNAYWAKCTHTTDHCCVYENGEFAEILNYKNL